MAEIVELGLGFRYILVAFSEIADARFVAARGPDLCVETEELASQLLAPTVPDPVQVTMASNKLFGILIEDSFGIPELGERVPLPRATSLLMCVRSWRAKALKLPRSPPS